MAESQEPALENNQTPSTAKNEVIKAGNIAIDPGRHVIQVSGQPVDLSPIEFAILTHLARRAPQVVSPQELVQDLYDYEPDPEEASAIIRTNIYRIRQKLRDTAGSDEIIRTVRGVGYSLQLPTGSLAVTGRMVDGRYRLLEQLGAGGTATVYRAYQESLDRHVAIKFLQSSLQSEADFRERFRMEAQYVASLAHPNIVRVHDYGTDGANCYIVMEQIEGITLEEKLHEFEARGQRMPLPEALRIVRETGQALAYAHRRQMIHRDIKPGNIMLARDGRVVIMDFGLAKLVTAPHLTREGHISGTPNYMSPEQIQNHPLDTRVDIYSLGVVMYRLLTGRLPFHAENEIAILFQQVKDPPPLPHTLVDGLPEGIEYIVLKALAKQPDKRYQTVMDMLADLAEPEAVSGAVADVIPSLTAQRQPPHFLPAPRTPFVPRWEELVAIQRDLMLPTTRLLTLVGVGGTGKTRLALEVAQNLLGRFADGAFFVDLTALQMPALLPGMIARIIGMAEAGTATVQAQLIDYLSQRQLLLVVDNFEHIMAAVPLLGEILSGAPQVKILATSREPLRLYGERLFKVAPLPLPDLRQQLAFSEISQYAAVRLFAERARAVDPDFSLTPENARQVAEICVQLDGLPLALELAAGEVYNYSLSELAGQLAARLAFLTEGPRDRAARQQTMRGAIDWSFELLTPVERATFGKLSVFAGRFSSEAAREVVGAADVTRLARKSLLQQEVGADGQVQFWLLQVLREYAREQLPAGPELAELQAKHTAYYLRLAESSEPHIPGPDQNIWLQRLEAAHDNLRIVLRRALGAAQLDIAVRLASILWRMWAAYSYLSEGSVWLETILAAAPPQPTQAYALTLFGAGRLAMFQQKREQAASYFEQSLDLFRRLDDSQGQANLLNSLGEIALQQGQDERAQALFDEAIALFRAAADDAGVAHSLNNLAQLAFYSQAFAKAHAYLSESLVLGEKLGLPESTAITLNGLGEIARLQDDYEAAGQYYERALAIYEQLNYAMGQAIALHNLGQVKLVQAQFDEAKRVFRQSLSLLRTMEEKIFVAWNLTGLGIAILNTSSARHAVRLFSAAQNIFAKFGGQLDAADQAIYDANLSLSRERLAPHEWQQAWEEGLAMPVENEMLNIVSLTPIYPQSN